MVIAIFVSLCLFLLVSSPVSAAHFGYRPLQRNLTGEDVEELQWMLSRLGYYKGTVSGGYTKDVEAAVKTMQKVYNLPQTGKVDGKTLEICKTLWSVFLSGEMEVSQVAPQFVNRPGQKVQLHVYRVQRGDTLTGIARRYKVQVADIAKLNQLACPSKIITGQKLYVVTAK